MKIFEQNKNNIFDYLFGYIYFNYFCIYKITYPFVLAFILAYLLGPINHRLSSFILLRFQVFFSTNFVIMVFLVLSLATQLF